MKLKFKLIVAAAALAVAGQASAAISTSASGNGEMFLSVYDANANMSYTKDLGITIDAFLAGSSSNLSFASDSLLDGFKTAGVLNSGITWGIGATDKSGVNRILTTTNAPTGTASGQIGSLNGGQLRTMAANTDVYLMAVNDRAVAAFGGSTSTAVNSAITATPADGSYVPTNNVDTWAGAQTVFHSMSNVGTAQNFFLLSTVGTGSTTKILVNQFTNTYGNSTWNLGTDGTLSYMTAAAVPEADTWAMFGVGLLMIGAIARRRMQS
ncbi:MAG: hypothetical protein WC029_02870 [Sulfuricella sp.]|jgi:hypothetical protein